MKHLDIAVRIAELLLQLRTSLRENTSPAVSVNTSELTLYIFSVSVELKSYNPCIV